MGKVVVGVWLALLSLIAGCSPSPAPATASLAPTASAPSGQPPASSGSASPPPASAAPSRAVMLIVGPARAKQQLFALDPAAPGTRVPLTVPPGRWSVAASANGVALSSAVDPPTVVLTALAPPRLVPSATVHLPGGDRWSGGYAACLSSAGTFLAADSGVVLFYFDGSAFQPIEGQRDHRGSCAWLNDHVVVWDNEDGTAVAWDATSRAIMADPLGTIDGRRFSAGGGLLCWTTTKNEVVVAPIDLSGAAPSVGPEVARIAEASGGNLSSDGTWLTVRFLDDSSAIYPLTASGVGEPTAVTLDPGESVAWTTAEVP